MRVPRSGGIKPQSISSNIEKLVVILTSVGLISADAVAHMPLHRGRVGCGSASTVEASLAEKNPRARGCCVRVLMVLSGSATELRESEEQ